jgi:hypothetical protein
MFLARPSYIKSRDKEWKPPPEKIIKGEVADSSAGDDIIQFPIKA